MKKAKFTSRQGDSKSLKCKMCQRKVENIDDKATAVTCWRCVCKSLNPRSLILSDLSSEEIEILMKKTNGRSAN